MSELKKGKIPQAKLILDSLPELAAFLEAFPGFVEPYGTIRIAKFVDNLDDFLAVCHYMGDCEKEKNGEHYQASRTFGKAITVTVYMDEKYLAPKPVIPPELKNWGKRP